MATTKTPATRKRTTAKTRTTAPRAAAKTKTDQSLAARTGRTIRDRPYTSAAIATGAVTAVAAAAAGAFFFSRRDKSFKEASEELTTKVKDGFATASETVKGGFASASESVKGSFTSASERIKELSNRDDSLDRGQEQIAEEALTLKETGKIKSPVDTLSNSEIKTGAIAY